MHPHPQELHPHGAAHPVQQELHPQELQLLQQEPTEQAGLHGTITFWQQGAAIGQAGEQHVVLGQHDDNDEQPQPQGQAAKD